MKRIITLLLLAGLLTASLSSCVKTGKRKEEHTSVDPTYITTGENGEPNTPSAGNPGDFQYIDDVRTVYVKTATAKLTPVAGGEAVTLKQFAADNQQKLTRTQVSANANKTWSKVTYENADYYVLTSALTTADLLAENFTAADQEMYVVNANSLNVREFPAAEDTKNSDTIVARFPKLTGALALNDKVHVIATSASGWYKIEYTENEVKKTGYVSSSYLSTAKGGDPADYLKYFNSISDTAMYVSVDKANVREAPYSKGDKAGKLIADAPDGIVKGTAVTVVGKGFGEFASWYQVKWTDKVQPGYPQTYSRYYISADCVSLIASATLQDYLNTYPELNPVTKTLFVAGKPQGDASPTTVNGRKIPQVTENKDDIAKILYGCTQVNVVAIGTFTDGIWCLAKENDTSFFFVKYSYLTADPNGDSAYIPLTKAMLYELYPDVFSDFVKTATANGEIKAFNLPDATNGKPALDIASGATVSIVAKGTIDLTEWYMIEDSNGNGYFITPNQVTVK